MDDRKTTNHRDFINKYFAAATDILGLLPAENIEQIISRIDEARWRKKTIFICGNGGSAATATHFASDLSKGTQFTDKPFIKAKTLCDNTALLSAWANDLSYEDAFSRILAPWVGEGDILVVISGSGNSPNVLNAVATANNAGATTIGLTGFDGGKLKDMVDTCIIVPSYSMEQVEDIHLLLCHVITVSLREL